MAKPEIKVHEDIYAPISGPGCDLRFTATFGAYDLGYMIGQGATPLDAIRELLDEEEFWQERRNRGVQ